MSNSAEWIVGFLGYCLCFGLYMAYLKWWSKQSVLKYDPFDDSDEALDKSTRDIMSKWQYDRFIKNKYSKSDRKDF
tara:strand:- start:138 stop:365 length:228 start_codon:yes stop_codon:yes gene_type:complete